MSDEIDLIASQDALKGLDQLIEKLTIADELLLKANDDAFNFSKGISGVKTTGDLNKALKESADLRTKLARAEKAEADALAALEKAITAETAKRIKANQEKQQSIAITKKEEEAIAKKMQADEKAQQVLEKGQNVYNRVNARVRELEQSYFDLALRQQLGQKLNDKEIAQLVTMETRLNMYRTALNKVKEKVQVYGGNVGNYPGKTPYNALDNSIGQITRELPSFGISPAIGIMSLTNNIGQLQDSITGLVAKNKLLIAQGKPVESVFSQIMARAISLNTLLYVSIGLYTANSEAINSWVASLFGASDALNKTATALKDAADANERFKTIDSEVITSSQKKLNSLLQLTAVMKDESKTDEERANAMKRIRDLYPGYLQNLSDEELMRKSTVNQSQKYIDVMRQLRADLGGRVVAEAQQGQADKNLKLAADLEEEAKIRERANDEIATLASKRNDDIREAEAAGESKDYIKKIEEQFESEKQNVTNRIKLREELYEEDKAFNEKFNGLGIASTGSTDYLGAYSDAAIVDLQVRAKYIRDEFDKQQEEINKTMLKTSLLDFKPDKKNTDKRTKSLRESTKANKDYLQSEFELVKMQLENAIKYNTEIRDNEAENFDQRRRAALQLTADRTELAERELKEDRRRNEFRLEEQLRVNEIEKRNELSKNADDLKNKVKTVNESIKITAEYAEKENGIRRDYRAKDLIAFVKYSDTKRTIEKERYEAFLRLEKLARETADEFESITVSEAQLNALRQLNQVLANVSTESSMMDFARAEQLKLDLVSDFTRKNLEIKLRAASDELAEVNNNYNRRVQLEKELSDLLKGESDSSTADRIKNIQDELSQCVLSDDIQSKSYADKVEKIKVLEIQLANLKVAEAERVAAKVKSINNIEVNFKTGSADQKMVQTLTEIEKSTLDTLIQNLKDGKAGAEVILDQYAQALTVYKQLGKDFTNALTTGEKAKIEELFENVAAGTEGADLALRNYLKSLGLMKTYFDKFADEFESESGLKTFFDFLHNSIENLGEDWRVTFLALTEIAQEFYNFLNKNSEKNFENERARLEAQKEIALQTAGDSESGKLEIEKQYEAKKKEIRKRELKAQKEIAEFNAIINTAQAVVAELAKGGYAAAIAAGILGLAQIALIESQPIPEYWQGGTTPGGVVRVNDDPKGVKGHNFKEVIRTPEGKFIFPQKRNQLMDLPKGSEVFPDYDSFLRNWNGVLGENGIDPIKGIDSAVLNAVNNTGLTKDEFFAGIDDLATVIQNKVTFEMFVDKGGAAFYQKTSNARTKLLNNQLRMIGHDV